MTIAVFRRKGHEWEINISGHAGYNPNGPDIVCGACSVLTCTMVQCINELVEKGVIKDLVTAVHSGDVKLSFKALRDEPHTAVHTVMTGFFMLESTYPDYVKCVYTNAPQGGAAWAS